MLTLLTRLEDLPRIEGLLAKIAAAGGYDKQDNDAIISALARLSLEKRAAIVERLIAATAEKSLSACGDLLMRAVPVLANGRNTDFVDAAVRLVEALPGDPARPAVPDMWRQGRGVDLGFIVDLLTALGQIDEALAGRATDHILAWPGTYRCDAVLVPAIRKLVGMSSGSAAVRRLRPVCLDHLRARIAQPLEAPKDWRRASALACSCRHCAELGRFLADPERRMWIFKAAEGEWAHVEGTITRARCDLDLTTDKRGRPYTLVCTKNQASYDCRAEQRKQDLEPGTARSVIVWATTKSLPRGEPVSAARRCGSAPQGSFAHHASVGCACSCLVQGYHLAPLRAGRSASAGTSMNRKPAPGASKATGYHTVRGISGG